MDDRLTAVIAGVVASLGADLDDVTLGGGKTRMLRIVVDKEGGLGIDEITEISREVSAVLDADSSIQRTLGQTPFTLEVTTRGVDRPLTLPRHWQRNVDRLVTVTLTDDSSLTGRIAGANDSAVTLAFKGDEQELNYSDISRALVQIELNRKDV